MNAADQLRLEAVAAMRANDFPRALRLLDEALMMSNDARTRELLRVTKAGAMIELGIEGAEVRELAEIVLRRRDVEMTFRAAYNLSAKFERERLFSRAYFYARVALECAEELKVPLHVTEALVACGNLCVFDSKLAQAAHFYRRALEFLRDLPDADFHRAAATQNLGYCALQRGEIDAGLALVHEAAALLESCGGDGFLEECHLDLCFGYLSAGDYDRAREYGELVLASSSDYRQVRNAHFLLGEVARECNDVEAARAHFDQLARFYPECPNLSSLMLSIGIRHLVNFKL